MTRRAAAPPPRSWARASCSSTSPTTPRSPPPSRRSARWTCSSTTRASPASSSPLPEVTVEHLKPVFEVNVYGPVRVLQAFRPLLEQSVEPGRGQRVQRHGLDRRHQRPGPDRVHAAQPHLRAVQDGAEHAHDAVGEGVPELPHQRGRPGLHRHRLQPPQRPADRRRRARTRSSSTRRSAPTARPAATSTATASCPGECARPARSRPAGRTRSAARRRRARRRAG